MSVKQFDIKDLAGKYGLSNEVGVDFWKHEQSGQWILTHDACEKIAVMENIRLHEIKPLNSSDTLVRFLISMVKVGEDGKTAVNQITSVGEADTNNCKGAKYLGCMAEKRGIDRCVLKLVNAYQWGVSSETEADDFSEGKK